MTQSWGSQGDRIPLQCVIHWRLWHNHYMYRNNIQLPKCMLFLYMKINLLKMFPRLVRQWVKVLAAKPEDLSSIPVIHTHTQRERNDYDPLSSDCPTHTMTHSPIRRWNYFPEGPSPCWMCSKMHCCRFNLGPLLKSAWDWGRASPLSPYSGSESRGKSAMLQMCIPFIPEVRFFLALKSGRTWSPWLQGFLCELGLPPWISLHIINQCMTECVSVLSCVKGPRWHMGKLKSSIFSRDTGMWVCLPSSEASFMLT